MKSRILKFLTICAFTFSISGIVSCGEKAENEEMFDYERLYQNKMNSPYEEKDYDTIFASYGYYLNKKQGYNNWYYTSDNKQLSFSSEEGLFANDTSQVTFNNGNINIKNSNFSYEYKVKRKGKITIFGNLKINKVGSKLNFKIKKNNEVLQTFSYNKALSEGIYIETDSIQVDVGDNIIFEFIGDSEINFNPGVTYTNGQNTSLYHKTTFGHLYGDVFPYYDEETETLYNGFLWTDDARNGQYNFALEKSSNLLKFREVSQNTDYSEWTKYENEYNLSRIRDVSAYIDLEKYNLVRDNFLYFDEDNNRYLLIAGCYYNFDSSSQTSDLVIYESNDSIGFDWNKNGNVVSGTYSKNLPECPSLMKIGNRWYPFVSVAYKTAHQVGQLQYWIGDENVDCIDMKYNQNDIYFLDGEDLCAARVTNIKDKVYMWGWIPSTYDTMPWAPRGGYLNLPREVIQNEDGTLGGRLDPALSKLLNYGNIYTLGDNNYEIVSSNTTFKDGNLKGQENKLFLMSDSSRDYIEATIENIGADEFGFELINGQDRYLIKIYKEANNLYMSVESPNDAKHKINSFLKINPDITNFNIKIVHDGPFIEFFVNDKFALTANTSMKENIRYNLNIYSLGDIKIDIIKVNKLISYEAIEG